MTSGNSLIGIGACEKLGSGEAAVCVPVDISRSEEVFTGTHGATGEVVSLFTTAAQKSSISSRATSASAFDDETSLVGNRARQRVPERREPDAQPSEGARPEAAHEAGQVLQRLGSVAGEQRRWQRAQADGP